MTKQINMTRRQFLVATAATGAVLSIPWHFDVRSARAFYQSAGLQKFIQTLRLPGNPIPVAASDGIAAVTGAVHYSLTVNQFTDQLHPTLGPTTLWGYNPSLALGGGSQPQKHLGGIFVVQKGVPVQLTVTNNLPPQHILSVDVSANFPDAANRYGGSGLNAITTHLHGGLTPWISDGGPMTWFTPKGPKGGYGPSTASSAGNIYQLLNPKLKTGQAEYYYPNNQSARFAWYHDHAHDLTRLNAYAGIASAYLIRDGAEAALIGKGLPAFLENGGLEIPIVIQDKIFIGTPFNDPTWNGSVSSPGSLWYPHTYETVRWDQGPATLTPLPDPSVIPEMFGDTMLANGTVYPQATVEARRYRLRVLNACQARFLNLQLYVDDGSADGITYKSGTNTPTNAAGPNFVVIGTEGGFLPNPVTVPSNRTFSASKLSGSLITGPAERWDLLVDFTGFAGKKVILYNDAPAPFPVGDPINDYFPGAPGNPTQPTPGFGPNTRTIMRFNVVPATGQDDPLVISGSDLTAGLDPFLVPPGVSVQNGAVVLPKGTPTRQLTLNETFDQYGRLIQLLGTNAATGPGLFGRSYEDPATETPRAGATEAWQIANLTGDTHPIHFHLVNVQVLARQPFNVKQYNGTPTYTGAATAPDPTEQGWKETVRMNPGEVTTVIMKFTLPTIPNVVVPTSPNSNLGVSGYEYVWHCHILEHEEHDMMRPLVVIP